MPLFTWGISLWYIRPEPIVAQKEAETMNWDPEEAIVVGPCVTSGAHEPRWAFPCSWAPGDIEYSIVNGDN